MSDEIGIATCTACGARCYDVRAYWHECGCREGGTRSRVVFYVPTSRLRQLADAMHLACMRALFPGEMEER